MQTDALDIAAIEAALDSMLDFSGQTIDSNIIEKFVCRITSVDNGHYRWDLNFAPNKKQAIIGAVEGRKGKANAEIKEYGEDDEHPHRTYDRSIQFSADVLWGKLQYHFLRHCNLSFAFLGMTIKSEFYCQKCWNCKAFGVKKTLQILLYKVNFSIVVLQIGFAPNH